MIAAQPATPAEAIAPPDTQIESLKYINRLASMSGTPIGEWKLLDIFNDGQGKLIAEHAEINKRFFERKAAQPKVDNTEAFGFFRKGIESFNVRSLDGIKSQHMNTVTSARERIHQYTVSTENEIRRLGQATEMIRAIEAGDTPRTVSESIEKVLAKGFWTLWNVNEREQWVEFVTTADIVLEHKNAKAKVDLQANFGRFRAKLHLATRDVRVLGHRNNLVGNSSLHPHVYSDGRLCWGSAADVFSDAMSMLNIADVLDLLSTILANYNPESPITSLSSFDPNKKINMSDAWPPWKKKPEPTPEQKADPVYIDVNCSECERHVDECECSPV